MTEREKMLSGELYDDADPELVQARRRARDLLRAYNASREDETEARREILGRLLGAMGAAVEIQPPFYCDYGENIALGDRVYFNFNCVVLDPAPVTIGSDVLFGPNVQIYTATHPIEFEVRRTWRELARPIDIGSDVWIGGGAILCPGVRVGSRSVIGAGSVVTRDVPDGVFAAGNPCRVLRTL
jgi:maltose O-acetyltransferase